MSWLINDCDLLTIKDQYQLGESLKEFVHNLIYKHNNWNCIDQSIIISWIVCNCIN